MPDEINFEYWIDQVCDQFDRLCHNKRACEVLDAVVFLDSCESQLDSTMVDFSNQRREELLIELWRIQLEWASKLGADLSITHLKSRFPQFNALLQQFDRTRTETAVSGQSALRQGLQQIVKLREYVAGSRMGPFELVEQLGAGGMGAVWRAKQTEPVRREVALKLIRSGIRDPKLVSRFRVECQALAVMSHPNIARMLDSGQTDDGVPYLVMELVSGLSITRLAEKSRLSVRQRVELFLPVCHAVQHAHQKGIIHRDLKPSNILVADEAGKLTPKVIDFGLVKATEKATSDESLHTLGGHFVGTLDYMSPEQTRAGEIDLDTRTDIYSLGAVLYQLLTGSRPSGTKRLAELPIDSALSVIRHQDPQLPSQRVASLRQEDSTGESAVLSTLTQPRELAGDLDWIVMKALDKDRNRRYESAAALAKDLMRYMRGEPVDARPPSTRYRFRKYIQRNRGLVLSATSIFLLLIAGTLISCWMAFERNHALVIADIERKQAQKHSEIALENSHIAVAARNAADLRSERLRRETARANFQLANARWGHNRVAEAKILLDLIPEDLRNFEWYYCSQAFQGSDITLYGHDGEVTCISWSADGKRIFSGGHDGTVRIWDSTSGAEVACLKGHNSDVMAVRCSAAQSIIASADINGVIKIWDDWQANDSVDLLKHHGAVLGLDFSPDGSRIVTGGEDGTVKVWDVVSKRVLHDFSASLEAITCVAYSPSSNSIAAGSRDATIRIWNLDSPEQTLELAGHTSHVLGIEFSPDGKRLISGSLDETIRLWDVASRNQIEQFNGQKRFINSVAWSPDGLRFASAGWDSMVRVWELGMREPKMKLIGHWAQVKSLCFSPDATRLASCGYDRTIKVWDVTSGRRIVELRGHQESVFSLCYLPDGKHMVSGSGDQTIKLWDTSAAREVSTFAGHTGRITQVAVSPDTKRIASGSIDQSLKIWDIENKQVLIDISLNADPVFAITFSPNGKYVVAGNQNHTIKLVESTTGIEITEFRGHTELISTVAFAPDGRCIASGGLDNTITIWEAEQAKPIHRLTGHQSWVECVRFSSDGTKLVSGSSDTNLKVWDVELGAELFTLSGHTDRVFSAGFSPDKTRIVSGSSDNTVKLWDAADGFELLELPGHVLYVWSVAFSPDGWTIASAGEDKTIKIWAAKRERELREFRGHSQSVDSVAISDDGLFVWSRAGEEEFVWDISTGERRDAPQGFVNSGRRTSPDGRWWVGKRNKDVWVVDLDFKKRSDEVNYRKVKARPKEWWHREQLSHAVESDNEWAAAFHRGQLQSAQNRASEFQH